MHPKKIKGNWYVVDKDDKIILAYPFRSERNAHDWIERKRLEQQLNRYEKIKWRDFFGVVRDGYSLGEWLIVTPNRDNRWAIIVRPTKKKAVSITFHTALDALKFGQKLTDMYESYFPAWLNELDPFAITKWSVKDGLYMWCLLEMFDNHVVRLDELSKPACKTVIKERMKHWTRSMKWD